MTLGNTGLGTALLGGNPPATVTDGIRSDLSSSRKVNIRGRYEVNDEGGFAPMDDTAQRVLLLTAFALPPDPPFIDQRFAQTVQQNWRKALEELTRGPRPAIRITRLAVERDRAGATSRILEYTNLRTGTTQTVTG